MSRIDQYYRRLIVSNLFRGAWGDYEGLSKIVNYRRAWVSKRETCLQLVPVDHPVRIDKEVAFDDHSVIEASFESPCAQFISELMPNETRRATFQFLVPKKWSTPKHKPVFTRFSSKRNNKKEDLLLDEIMTFLFTGGLTIRRYR